MDKIKSFQAALARRLERKSKTGDSPIPLSSGPPRVGHFQASGNWLTVATGTEFPDPIAGLAMDYLEPTYDTDTVDPRWAKPVDAKTIEGLERVKQRDLYALAPGALLVIRRPGSKEGHWAVAVTQCRDDGVEVELPWMKVDTRQIPVQSSWRERSVLQNVGLGATTRRRLKKDAEVFIFEPPAAADWDRLPDGTKLLRDSFGPPAVVFVRRSSDTSRVIVKFPWPKERGWVANLGVDDARVRSADPAPDYQGRGPWIEMAMSTMGTVSPHPFYYVDPKEAIPRVLGIVKKPAP